VPSLVKAIARARDWYDRIVSGQITTMSPTGSRIGVTPAIPQADPALRNTVRRTSPRRSYWASINQLTLKEILKEMSLNWENRKRRHCRPLKLAAADSRNPIASLNEHSTTNPIRPAEACTAERQIPSVVGWAHLSDLELKFWPNAIQHASPWSRALAGRPSSYLTFCNRILLCHLIQFHFAFDEHVYHPNVATQWLMDRGVGELWQR